MKVAASAPGRCGIIGNPSDIYGGFLVSCSVPLRNRCTLETTNLPTAQEDAVLWKAAIARLHVPPVSASWTSEVPRSSGLAGSTALLSAMVACILAIRGEWAGLETAEERSRTAELVRDIELREAQVVCGYQDAYMAVYGGLQAIDFAGKHPLEPGPLAFPRAMEAPLPFLLVTTGVERLSGSVHGPIRDRWLAGEGEVVRAMERIAELGRAGADALETEDWPRLAEAMEENHRIVASLGGSGEAIDALIQRCRQNGALAAKLAGAGLGGTVIALAEDVPELQARLAVEGYCHFLRPEPTEGLRIDELA